MKQSNFIFYNFIKPAFESKKKFVIVRAGRRVGKTFAGVQKICLFVLTKQNSKGLWVDTVQSNIAKYIERYFKPILGDIWESIEYDKQKQILTFANGSIIDFGSAERPENLEGFGYDIIILNEAGIILKKEGLWERTIAPMGLNAQVFFIGTPKGKTGHKYFELSQLALNNPDWVDFHFPAIESPEYTQEILDNIKQTTPSYLYSQEYIAEFVDVYENSLLSPNDIKYYDNVSIENFDQLYLYADTTHTAKTTSDYFALVIIGQNKIDKFFYIIDFVLTKKLTPMQQIETIISYFERYPKIIKGNYDAVSNDGFEEFFKKICREQNKHFNFSGVKFQGDKVKHFLSSGNFDKFKSHSVLLPKFHSQIAIAVDQLLAFPQKNINDDFVDGLSGALDNFQNQSIDDIFNKLNKSAIYV
jgi:predicted phage terminase large subunit-like protein